MRAMYDIKDDVLYLEDGRPHVVGSELLHSPGTVVHLTTEEGHDISALTIIGATAYLPLELGYDAESDTLTIGQTTKAPGMVGEAGEFVGYWEIDELDPDGFQAPIGVAIKHASKHLAPVIASLARDR